VTRVTRINDHLLVQRVDDLIVVIDESAGEEVAFAREDAANVVFAITYLAELPFVISNEEVP
jgi:hypothetical protein